MKKDRLLSLFLASLIAVGSNVPSFSKAETKPLNMKSIFTMTEEESKKEVIVEDIGTLGFQLYNRFLFLPAMAQTVRIVSDGVSLEGTTKSAMTQSGFKDKFYNSNVERILPFDIDITLFTELSSGDILGFTSYRYSKFQTNELFFKNVDPERYEKEGCELKNVSFGSPIE